MAKPVKAKKPSIAAVMDSVFCSIFEDDSYLTVSQDIDKFCNDIAKY